MADHTKIPWADATRSPCTPAIETEYLSLVQTGESPSGKTLVFCVRNRSWGYTLGEVRWHGPWRQYVFIPRADAQPMFSAGCLSDVVSFVEQATEAHRVGVRARRVPAWLSTIPGSRGRSRGAAERRSPRGAWIRSASRGLSARTPDRRQP